MVPAGIITSNGLLITGGIAMSTQGVAFASSIAENRIYFWKDLNGDGFAFGGNEVGVYATLPHTPGILENMMYGIGLAGGNTLMVNVRPQAATTNSDQGIYWVVDKNNDGDANDANEVVYYNSTPVINGFDGGCISAPH